MFCASVLTIYSYYKESEGIEQQARCSKFVRGQLSARLRDALDKSYHGSRLISYSRFSCLTTRMRRDDIAPFRTKMGYYGPPPCTSPLRKALDQDMEDPPLRIVMDVDEDQVEEEQAMRDRSKRQRLREQCQRDALLSKPRFQTLQRHAHPHWHLFSGVGGPSHLVDKRPPLPPSSSHIAKSIPEHEHGLDESMDLSLSSPDAHAQFSDLEDGEIPGTEELQHKDLVLP